MLHSRRNKNIVKHLHERCLRLIYNDKPSSYYELLLNNGSVSVHQKHIQNSATEIFEVKSDLPPEIVTDIILEQAQTQYNLRHHN